jgi:hypothetical protein
MLLKMKKNALCPTKENKMLMSTFVKVPHHEDVWGSGVRAQGDLNLETVLS